MRTDAELVDAWQRGDAAALGAVYDRYGGAIHGFALARTRSAADAADVLQDTFVRAATRVHQLREPERLRAWLFAIARRRVYDLAQRRDVVSPRADDDRPGGDPSLDAMLVRDEVHELVWAAAGSLNDRDRELLELHLRDGLEGADLAAVVGLAPSHVHTLVNRLRERMAKAVGALLVARHARRSCAVLDGVLAGWDGRFTLDVRSKVTRHVEACATCTGERAGLLVPGWFTAGALALPVALPPELRDRVLGAARAATPDDASTARRAWRHDGFPVVPRRRGHGRRPFGGGTTIAGLVAGAAIVVGSVAVLAGRDDGGQAVVEVRPGASAEATVTTMPSPSDAIDAVATTDVTPPVPATPAADPTPSMATLPAVPAQGADRSGDASTAGGIPGEVRPAPPATTVPGVSSTSLPATSPPTSSAGTGAGSGTGGAGTPSGETGTTTSVASTAPPTTAAAAPAALQLSTSSVALGSATSGSFTVSNQGGQPATLAVTSTSSTLAASGGGATVAPGGSVTVTVTLDRAAEAEGTRTFAVSVSAAGASGGGQVTVTATVERNPTITSISRTPTTIRTSTSCGQTLTRVSVDATDESGIAGVSVLWSSDGTFGQRTSLSLDSTGHWTAQIGSFSITGTRTLTVEVTDTRGNHVNGSTTVVVVAC